MNPGLRRGDEAMDAGSRIGIRGTRRQCDE